MTCSGRAGVTSLKFSTRAFLGGRPIELPRAPGVSRICDTSCFYRLPRQGCRRRTGLATSSGTGQTAASLDESTGMKSMGALRLRSTLRAAVLGGTVLVLTGCAAMHHGYETIARPSGTPVVDANPAGTTTSSPAPKQYGTRPRLSLRAEPDGADPVAIRTAAIPTPGEIFDFHPGGSSKWRAPVIIDANDGPLTREVRQTAQELKEFEAAQKLGEPTAKLARCSEVDAAAMKAGCTDRPKAAHASRSTPGPDKSAVQ